MKMIPIYTIVRPSIQGKKEWQKVWFAKRNEKRIGSVRSNLVRQSMVTILLVNFAMNMNPQITSSYANIKNINGLCSLPRRARTVLELYDIQGNNI
jgi:hypothetical protein